MAIVVHKKQSAPGLMHGGPGSRTRVSASNLYTETSLGPPLSVTLHWSAPNVAFNPANSIYQIYKANSFINTVPATQFYYVDTAVMPGVSYEYSVFLIYNPA